MEGLDNSGFTTGRDDLFWLTRLRVNATITPSRNVSFQVQAQDARVAKKTDRYHRDAVQGRDRPAARRSWTWVAVTGPVDRCASAGRSRVWRTAARRPRQLAQRRTFDAAMRVDRHGAEDEAAARRLRCLRRAHSARRVRQERQWQSLLRRVRDDDGDPAEERVEPYLPLAADRGLKAPSRAPSATLQLAPPACPMGGNAAGQLRLPHRDGDRSAARWVRTRCGRGRATGSSARSLGAPARCASHVRIQLRIRRRESRRRHPGHVRSALSDGARQVRPGRSGRLAQHPPRARRARRQAAINASPDQRELPLVVAGRRRDGALRAGGALLARIPTAPPVVTSVRSSTCRSRTR